jgi:hypothetical protein
MHSLTHTHTHLSANKKSAPAAAARPCSAPQCDWLRQPYSSPSLAVPDWHAPAGASYVKKSLPLPPKRRVAGAREAAAARRFLLESAGEGWLGKPR